MTSVTPLSSHLDRYVECRRDVVRRSAIFFLISIALISSETKAQDSRYQTSRFDSAGIINAAQYPGATADAQIRAAINGSACRPRSSCTVDASEVLGTSGVATLSGPIAWSKPIRMIFGPAIYRWTGPAVSGGLFQPGAGADGSEITCRQMGPRAQGMAYGVVGKCVIDVQPGSGSMPIIGVPNTINLNGLYVHDISVAGNKHVTDFLQFNALSGDHVHVERVVATGVAARNIPIGWFINASGSTNGELNNWYIANNEIDSWSRGSNFSSSQFVGLVYLNNQQMGATGPMLNTKAASVGNAIIEGNIFQNASLTANTHAIALNCGGCRFSYNHTENLNLGTLAHGGGIVEVYVDKSDHLVLEGNLLGGGTVSSAYNPSIGLLVTSNATNYRIINSSCAGGAGSFAIACESIFDGVSQLYLGNDRTGVAQSPEPVPDWESNAHASNLVPDSGFSGHRWSVGSNQHFSVVPAAAPDGGGAAVQVATNSDTKDIVSLPFSVLTNHNYTMQVCYDATGVTSTGFLQAAVFDSSIKTQLASIVPVAGTRQCTFAGFNSGANHSSLVFLLQSTKTTIVGNKLIFWHPMVHIGNDFVAYSMGDAPEPLTGVTGPIGGRPLAAGACASGTATILGLTDTMDLHATPTVYPGDEFSWEAYASGINTATVKVCARVAGIPKPSTYNVRAIQ